MTRRFRILPGVSLALVLAAAVAVATAAFAQQDRTAIWDIPFGTPAAELTEEFRITACGTNGGPPSTILSGFEEFHRCRPEQETGLYEVWFSYDDEVEYYLRAIRANPDYIRLYQANQIQSHLVVFSLLFDEEGRVQGHRIATDPRDESLHREISDQLSGSLRVAAYGADGWTCTDLPRLEGERPFGHDTFLKNICEKVDGGRYITMETHRYLKIGQLAAGRPGVPQPGQFEVGTWAQAINADLVGQTTPP